MERLYSLWNNNFVHVVECPCGLVNVFLFANYLVQCCNIAYVLLIDYKP